MTIYYHTHHIIPKHMGGTDDPSNLVKLTIEEHAQAHHDLYLKYGHWQDKCAWLALSGRFGKEEILRMKQSLANKGKKRSEETKRKISKSKLGTKQSKESNKKRSEASKGVKKSKEAIDNWRKSRAGYKHSPETIAKIKAKRALQKNVCGVIKKGV